MAALATLPDSSGTVGLSQPDLVVGAAAVIYNLLVGVLLILNVSDGVLRPATLAGDVLLAMAFFWASDASPLVMVGASLFAIITASLRYGRILGLVTTGIIGVLSLGLVALLPNVSGTQVVPLLIGLLFLALTTLLTSLVSAFKDVEDKPQLMVLDEGVIESNRLSAARERARAIYEMASTLGATLNYSKVLDAALDVGVLGLREMGSNNKMISAVLLFRGKQLHVATARRFSRTDEQVVVPGQRGVLGLALNQSDPVFAADAHHDPELQYFGAFAEARSILAIPLRAGFERYGVLLFGSNMPNAFSDEHVELLTAIGTQATIALQNAVLYQNLRQEKERIVEVEEDARKKLARDLHDGPTQSVAAIAMRVNYIRTLLERRPEDAGGELYKVEELARRTTKEIRHMLFTLRPLVLETQGLSAAFVQLAEKMKETHNLDVTVEAQPGADTFLESNAQGVLFYIVEEAVNNARKHAQAAHIWVRISRKGDEVVVEVQDDGLGFDVKAVNDNYEKRGSLGMINMRERAELAEGQLELKSAKGEGTHISIFVPIKPDMLARSAPPPAPEPTPPPSGPLGRARRNSANNGNAANNGNNGTGTLRSPAK